MQVLLETERLVLRRFTAADAEKLFDLDSDPEVMRFLSGGTPTPRDVIQNDILPRFLRYDERFPGYGFWAAIEKATGDFLGWFSFRPSEGAPDEVRLGFRLRRAAWGKGYATEGSRALIRKGFTELGAQRVVATTYQDNLASRRVLEKVGMTLVRSFRLTPEDLVGTGTYSVSSPDLWDGDDLEYALERADWARQESAGAR
ncbi:MAG: GNAT family N-acetyltransferase [Ardenticatenaceae bacterium]|nr:GNAT family N-acetyltransferase [Ardenticatenaceae bacterium]